MKSSKNEVKLNDYMTIGDQIKLEVFMAILAIWLLSPFILIVYLINNVTI